MRETDVREGSFITDGQKLYEVLRSWLPSGQVLLEDAGDPAAPSIVRTVTELVADGMRVVRTVSR